MVKKKHIDVRVNETEYNEIQLRAQSSSMTMSHYLRSAAMSAKIKSTIDIDAVLELGKVNADLARLGNLLKLALDTAYDNYNKDTIKNINALIYEMRSTQNKMRDIVLKI